MPDYTDKPYTVTLRLACFLVGMATALCVWAEEPTVGASDSQAKDVTKDAVQGAKVTEEVQTPSPSQQTEPQKIEPKKIEPKKTEYDKLPLAQLVQRAKAADLKAQFELGSRMNYGRGMPKDIKEALRWLRRAAQNGQQDAQRLLAVKFYNGFDVPVDHTEALRWTAQLAEGGDVPAQLSLANMYASGEGTERNLVRAYMWYDIAAAAGKTVEKEDASEGTENAGVEKAAQDAAKQRDKLAALLQPEQEVEAQQLSSDWWLKKQGVSLTEKNPASSSSQSFRPLSKPSSKASPTK